ncbi:MAG TPA: hypothetical protein VMI31_12120 [Fimbriimonadaceae bacterium]|nr:hypothetical protein [Fimbriimonadaceae bacterium]
MSPAELRLDEVTAADFAPHIGTEFRAEATVLTLSKAEELGAAGIGSRAPFILIFKAPAEAALGQGTYALDHEALGRLEIFLVPIGVTPDSRTYQAIFN